MNCARDERRDTLFPLPAAPLVVPVTRSLATATRLPALLGAAEASLRLRLEHTGAALPTGSCEDALEEAEEISSDICSWFRFCSNLLPLALFFLDFSELRQFPGSQ